MIPVQHILLFQKRVQNDIKVKRRRKEEVKKMVSQKQNTFKKITCQNETTERLY